MKDETEIVLGVVDVAHRSKPAPLIIAPVAVERPAEVAGAKGSSRMRTVALSSEQKAIAANLGISESEMARSIATRGPGPRRFDHLLAANSRGSAGFLRAHQEIDRAHNDALDGAPREALKGAPDGELLERAISELKAYRPNDPSAYDRLLRGALYAMVLLDRAAPAFAGTRKFKL